MNAAKDPRGGKEAPLFPPLFAVAIELLVGVIWFYVSVLLSFRDHVTQWTVVTAIVLPPVVVALTIAGQLTHGTVRRLTLSLASLGLVVWVVVVAATY